MEWYISRLGNTYGPLTFDDLISRARDGRLVKDDLVWSVGMKKWEISEGIAGLWLPPAPPSAVMPTPPVDTPPKPLPPPIPEPTESIFAPSIEFPKTSKSPNFILRFWRGDVRLPVAYWVVGFLFTIAIMGLSNAFGALVESLSLSRAQGGIVLALFLLFIVACTAWQLVGIWRSAGNYIKRSKTPFWGGFARVAVILGVIRAAVDFHTVIQPMLTESLKLAVGVEETPPYHLRLMHNGTEVELSGGMPFGTADALQKLLDAAPAVKLVHLNSMGGRIDEGYQIYKILHDKSLASYTSSGCMSACTIAFLGGNPRLLGSEGKLGFHSGSSREEDCAYDGLPRLRGDQIRQCERQMRRQRISHSRIPRLC